MENFEDALRDLWSRAYRVACRILRDSGDAEDAAAADVSVLRLEMVTALAALRERLGSELHLVPASEGGPERAAL